MNKWDKMFDVPSRRRLYKNYGEEREGKREREGEEKRKRIIYKRINIYIYAH